MQADQAAGLRSQPPARLPRVVSLIDVSAETSLRLAQALLAPSQRVVLIDSLGRHSRSRNTHHLFSWQQQVAQQRLQTWPRDGVEILHAPGAQAGDAAIVHASASYHAVLFDGYTLQADIALATQLAYQIVVLEVRADKRDAAYALMKTLAMRKLDWRVILLGDAALAARLLAARAHFLPEVVPTVEYNHLDSDAHLRAVAARISAADADMRPEQNNTEEYCAQHD